MKKSNQELKETVRIDNQVIQYSCQDTTLNETQEEIQNNLLLDESHNTHINFRQTINVYQSNDKMLQSQEQFGSGLSNNILKSNFTEFKSNPSEQIVQRSDFNQSQDDVIDFSCRADSCQSSTRDQIDLNSSVLIPQKKNLETIAESNEQTLSLVEFTASLSQKLQFQRNSKENIRFSGEQVSFNDDLANTRSSQSEKEYLEEILSTLDLQNTVQLKKVELNIVGKYISENNGKRPDIKISKYKIDQQNNLIHYTIESKLKPEFDSLIRTNQDFIRLHNNLSKLYIGCFIPPLPDFSPEKNKSSYLSLSSIIGSSDIKNISKISKENLDKIQIQLQYFIDWIMNSKLLRNSQFFQDFLIFQNTEYIKICCTPRYTMPTPNYETLSNIDVSQLYHTHSCFNTELVKNQILENYTKSFTSYNTQVKEKYAKIKQKSHEVIENLKDTSKSLQELSYAFQELHVITKSFNESNLVGVNSFLAESYNEQCQFLNNLSHTIMRQSNLIQDTIEIPLSYESMVSEAFETLTNQITKETQQYMKEAEKLITEKIKLFDSQNINSWKLDSNKQIPTDIKTNKEQAFKLMLPDKTKKLQNYENVISFLMTVFFQDSFMFMKVREFKNNKNYALLIKEDQKLLSHIVDKHQFCLKKIQDISQKSKESIEIQIKQESHRLVLDRSSTLLQGFSQA